MPVRREPFATELDRAQVPLVEDFQDPHAQRVGQHRGRGRLVAFRAGGPHPLPIGFVRSLDSIRAKQHSDRKRDFVMPAPSRIPMHTKSFGRSERRGRPNSGMVKGVSDEAPAADLPADSDRRDQRGDRGTRPLLGDALARVREPVKEPPRGEDLRIIEPPVLGARRVVRTAEVGNAGREDDLRPGARSVKGVTIGAAPRRGRARS